MMIFCHPYPIGSSFPRRRESSKKNNPSQSDGKTKGVLNKTTGFPPLLIPILPIYLNTQPMSDELLLTRSGHSRVPEEREEEEGGSCRVKPRSMVAPSDDIVNGRTTGFQYMMQCGA